MELTLGILLLVNIFDIPIQSIVEVCAHLRLDFIVIARWRPERLAILGNRGVHERIVFRWHAALGRRRGLETCELATATPVHESHERHEKDANEKRRDMEIVCEDRYRRIHNKPDECIELLGCRLIA
jgi:hypothetical protein